MEAARGGDPARRAARTSAMARFGLQERATFQAVRAACVVGLDSIALRERVSRILSRYLLADAYCSMELDPVTTLPVHDVTHGWPREYLAPLVEEALFKSTTADTGFLTRQSRRALILDELVVDHRPERDPYYRFHVLLFGYRHEIQFMCVSSDLPRALFTFNRRAEKGPFEARHLRLLESVAPHVGAAMHAACIRAALKERPAEGTGLIVLGPGHSPGTRRASSLVPPVDVDSPPDEERTMNEKNLIERVQALYAVFGRGDVGAIAETTASDVEWRYEVDPELHGLPPTVARFRGHDGVRAYFAAVGEHLDVRKLAPIAFLTAPGRVAVLAEKEMAFRRTGQSYGGLLVHLFDFDADGRIARLVHFDDTAKVRAAWGGRGKTAIVRRIYEAFGQGDVDTIPGLVHDDVDWASCPGSTIAPWHGVIRGKAALPRFFEALSTVQVTRFEPISFAENDGEVL
jgi:uncharacterized protein